MSRYELIYYLSTLAIVHLSICRISISNIYQFRKALLDSHTDVLFVKEQELLEFSDIDLYQIGI